MRFISSAMPESYQAVTTAIDIMFSQNEQEVTIGFVKCKLLLEESRQCKSKQGNPQLAFQIRSVRKSFGGNSRGRPGDWNQGVSRQFETGNFPFRCHFCDKVGHKKTDCYKWKHRSTHGKSNYRREEVFI